MGDAEFLRAFAHEKCAVAAAINIPLASRWTRNMLQDMQHRGEDGAGIVSSTIDRFRVHRGLGRVRDEFPLDFDFEGRLQGEMALGMNRYSTVGTVGVQENQSPFRSRNRFGEMYLSHNGQFVGAEALVRSLEQIVSAQSETDTEAILHLIARSHEATLEGALGSILAEIPAAYSLILMTPDKLIAARDPFGVRPLSLGRIGDGYLVASENSAFRIFGNVELVGDVAPGEMVIFDFKKIQRGERPERRVFARAGKSAHCIFEDIYFSPPRARRDGFYNEDFRMRCGRAVYRKHEAFFRALLEESSGNIACVPIPDSGVYGSIGFAEESGIPHRLYYQRRHNPAADGRSYTASTQEAREQKARFKLDLRRDKVSGKYIVTIDDSNVRGTTARVNNERLRAAGAKHITNIFLSPPIINACYLGMNHQDPEELIAHKYFRGDPAGSIREEDFDMEGLASEIGADKVIYLSLEDLQGVASTAFRSASCYGCFGGRYPVRNWLNLGKLGLGRLPILS